MSKVLVIAEHAGGKLNAATAKCVSAAAAIPGAAVTVAVLAADGAAVAAQAAVFSIFLYSLLKTVPSQGIRLLPFREAALGM